MNSSTTLNRSPENGDSGQGLTGKVCLPFLRQARNEDGGWGFHPEAASAVEPTAWCLLALGKIDPGDEAIEPGRRWLEGAQNADGSWPTRPQMGDGNWVTALAGLALLATNGSREVIAGAAQWVTGSQSGEGGLKMRLGRWLNRKKVVEQDFSLRGWSWTPGTSSWVEPTAVSLIFLRQLPAERAPAAAAERLRMAEAMLFDRMCPGGGWNLGNPKVYGVAGIPQIGPTAWALLALQEQTARQEMRSSLDWLAANADAMSGASSLALAHLALEACGRPVGGLEEKLTRQFEAHGFLGNVLSFAQSAFTLRPGRDVLRRAEAG